MSRPAQVRKQTAEEKPERGAWAPGEFERMEQQAEPARREERPEPAPDVPALTLDELVAHFVRFRNVVHNRLDFEVERGMTRPRTAERDKIAYDQIRGILDWCLQEREPLSLLYGDALPFYRQRPGGGKR